MKFKFPWKPEKIYIFPNKFGVLFFLSFILMILVAATYQNNLVFIMAFLQLSLGLIVINQTGRNLKGIKVRSVSVSPNYGGLPTRTTVVVENLANEKKNSLELSLDDLSVELKSISLMPLEVKIINATCVLPLKRGVYKVKRIKLSSGYPYGLFNCWMWFKTESEYEVYPLPSGEIQPQNLAMHGQGDFSEHRLYQDGDSYSKIDWKRYAKNNVLLTKKFDDQIDQKIMLKWDDTKQLKDPESRLSQLSKWVDYCIENQIEFGIQLPNREVDISSGVHHKHKCLKVLARYSGG